MDPSSSNLDGISVSWDSLSLGFLRSFGKDFEAEGDVEVNQEVCEEAQKELPILADKNQGNNSPSQPGTSRTPKKPRTLKAESQRSANQAYRQRLKTKKKEMQINLSKLGKEREERKRANESLINEKILAEQRFKQVNTQVAQLGSQVRSLNSQHAKLRILVDSFVKKMFGNCKIDEQLKKLNDELSSIEIGWENWMFEKLEHLNRIELLKNQNRILNFQVEALWEKKHKLPTF